jgi:hypothetical protein
MIVQGKLSLSQQATGRKKWHIFNMFNAVSFVCIADSVLYLFALEIGCPQYIIPIIASFMNLAFLVMPLGKVLSAKVGATSTIAFFWVLRSLFALIIAASPFVISWFGLSAGIVTLLVGVFGYFASRSAGLVAINPLLGEITLPEQRGKFTALIFRNFNFIALLGLVVISFVMKKHASEQSFQIIISCGVLFGLVSSFVVSRIAETKIPKESARIPIWHSLKSVDRTGKRLIFANIAGISGIVLVLPISIIAVKAGYNVTDSTALVCALIQFAGGVLIASISGIVSTHSGPRPVILIAFSL